jgi:hypothetical protein
MPRQRRRLNVCFKIDSTKQEEKEQRAGVNSNNQGKKALKAQVRGKICSMPGVAPIG